MVDQAPSQAARVLNALASAHRGKANGIHADRLAAQLELEPRDLRKLISELRTEGIAIVGTPETGYYVAETAEELDECCQFLRRRALHSLTLESKLRGVALPDLLGQLHLPT